VNPSFLDFPDDIERVDEYIHAAVQSDDGRTEFGGRTELGLGEPGSHGLLNEVLDYVHRGRGKKLRARTILLVSQGMGVLDDRALRAAACVEMIHCASLLHDDVIDEAPLRRGRPSVNAKYGDDVAILVADLLFSQAYDLALSTVEPEILRLVCRASRLMCESEMFQIEKRQDILTEEEYLRIIEAKTASLFAVCVEVGGVLSKVSPERRSRLARFGSNIGMAYQITDDALDYSAESSRWGKQIGNDLERGKLTLPLVYALEQACPADRRVLIDQLRNGRDINRVLPVIEKYRGLEYTYRRARQFAREAHELTPLLGLSSSVDRFHDLCHFVVDRTF
jgi:octaprenyl-diphosphate synthase